MNMEKRIVCLDPEYIIAKKKQLNISNFVLFEKLDLNSLFSINRIIKGNRNFKY